MKIKVCYKSKIDRKTQTSQKGIIYQTNLFCQQNKLI